MGQHTISFKKAEADIELRFVQLAKEHGNAKNLIAYFIDIYDTKECTEAEAEEAIARLKTKNLTIN